MSLCYPAASCVDVSIWTVLFWTIASAIPCGTSILGITFRSPTQWVEAGLVRIGLLSPIDG